MEFILIAGRATVSSPERIVRFSWNKGPIGFPMGGIAMGDDPRVLCTVQLPSRALPEEWQTYVALVDGASVTVAYIPAEDADEAYHQVRQYGAAQGWTAFVIQRLPESLAEFLMQDDAASFLTEDGRLFVRAVSDNPVRLEEVPLTEPFERGNRIHELAMLDARYAWEPREGFTLLSDHRSEQYNPRHAVIGFDEQGPFLIAVGNHRPVVMAYPGTFGKWAEQRISEEVANSTRNPWELIATCQEPLYGHLIMAPEALSRRVREESHWPRPANVIVLDDRYPRILMLRLEEAPERGREYEIYSTRSSLWVWADEIPDGADECHITRVARELGIVLTPLWDRNVHRENADIEIGVPDERGDMLDDGGSGNTGPVGPVFRPPVA
jgi:hypothetical protein